MNWMAIVPFTLKYATRIDNPTADSAAATTRMIKAKSCPNKESRDREAEINKRLIAKSISSIDIRSVKRFFLLTTIPKIPIRNNKKKNNINSVGDVAKGLLQ